MPAMLTYFNLPKPHSCSLLLLLLLSLLLLLLLWVASGRGPLRSDNPASCSSCRFLWLSQQGGRLPESLSLSDSDSTRSWLRAANTKQQDNFAAGCTQHVSFCGLASKGAGCRRAYDCLTATAPAAGCTLKPPPSSARPRRMQTAR